MKLNSLSITGFRAFEHLEIAQLGRVNLIVGKNNVGKTCLLEALRLYAHRGSPSVILDMLQTREEYNQSPQNLMDSEDHLKTISYIFYGWETAKPPHKKTLSIGLAQDPLNLVKVILGWYKETLDPDNQRRSYSPAIGDSLFPDDKRVADYFPGINIALANETPLTILLDRLFGERTMRYAWRPAIEALPCVFVPADGLNRKTATSFWDEIALRAGEDRVIEGLRIIAPHVERINLLGQSESRTARVPIVRIHGIQDPIPLRTLGEGMNRIFGLILAAVNAQNVILLVDEIASGLHYTVLKDLWAMLFQIAARLDIQIFATTHSWDCIESFQQAAQQTTEDAGMLIRLEQRQGHIVPILFDVERLSIATRQDIEVR